MFKVWEWQELYRKDQFVIFAFRPPDLIVRRKNLPHAITSFVHHINSHLK